MTIFMLYDFLVVIIKAFIAGTDKKVKRIDMKPSPVTMVIRPLIIEKNV